MLKDIEDHTPEEGYAVVGIDDFDIPGEQLFLIESFDNLKDAEAFAKSRSDEVYVYGGKEEVKSMLKAVQYSIGDQVKVMSSGNSHAGETGNIRKIMNNGNEDYYLIDFASGNDVYFSEELKMIKAAVVIPAKAEKYENEFEEKLDQQLKQKAKEISAALDLYGNSNLDQIQ